jgi:hypothetical protein
MVVRFVVDQVAFGQVIFPFLVLTPASIIPPVFLTPSARFETWERS